MPDVVRSPAPAGFPVGNYGRLVSFAGSLDGKWTLALNPDGTYLISRVNGDQFAGSYDVPATGRVILHGVDEDLHALMNAEWRKA